MTVEEMRKRIKDLGFEGFVKGLYNADEIHFLLALLDERDKRIGELEGEIKYLHEVARQLQGNILMDRITGGHNDRD